LAGVFDPNRVLRHVSNHLLEDLFETHQIELNVPWKNLGQTEVGPIFAAWQALPEAECRDIEIVLHEISDMASGDEGTRAMCEEAIRQGRQDLVDELDEYESRHDKAVWTYIRATDVWNLAVRFARADSLSLGRYWIKRCDIPAVAPDTSDEKREELEEALSAFFLATQARGKHCQIEHYRRASGVDYFFAYLDDYADTYVTLDNDGAFDRRDERRAFEMVMVYDRDHGTLEMYARGGKKVYVPLQEIFCRVILGEEIGEENRDSHPYELNALLESGFQFPTEPADGIDSVRVRKMRLSIKGLPRRRIILEADPDGGVNDIYEMMQQYLDEHQLPASILNVTQVGLKFSFNSDREDLPRSMSFDLSWPNSSNLKSKPEAPRELAEKYLMQWGLDRAPNAQSVQPAA
tara:strand:- start:11 stop:1228 length:1218 start_codon:yes stop_codon:yes gene_type:complete